MQYCNFPVETNPSDTSDSHITVDTTDPDFTITIPNTDPAQSKDVTITANGTDDDTVTYSAVLTTDSDNATCAATNDSVFSDPSTGIRQQLYLCLQETYLL